MKAIVLAAGRGTRMRAAADHAALDDAQAAAADAGLKAMIPFGRPFLDHVLHALADAGFDDIGLVLGPAHEQVRAYYRGLVTSRIRVSLFTQPEPRGTADALLAGEAWLADAPFIVLNSDNLYPVDVLARLRGAAGPAVPGFERDSLGLSIERLGAYALIETAPDGCLARVREKPGAAAVETAGPVALISANVWRCDARIFDACRDVPVSARGEKELPQAVDLAARRGVCFEVIRVRGAVLDLSRREDVAEVARRLDGARVDL
ncbi:MAG TPA: nucleotidyltransferase family protein [Vicinamibacterales bacterium]